MPQGPPVEPLHPSSEPPDITSFDHWALAPEVKEAIAAMGITTPTPIQRLAIQPALERRDVIAQAETGTGKTLAFGAPVMSKIDPSRVSVQALVLTPTRELAEQVAKVLAELGRARDISVVLIVGGEPAKPQVDALKRGAQVVVGTPGRVLDLMGQGFLSFPWTEFVVLDEADEMLEIGFLDDVEKILLATDPEIRNTLLFSATFPPELLRLARKHSKNPAEIATASGVATVTTIEQDYFVIADDDRPLALIRMIEQSDPDDVMLVFCERRTEVERLIRRLERLPFPIKALHGGYDQEARFRVMGAFRNREVKALVATDVASRGLDVAHVTHVVNYSVPRDVTSYTHRIGRTGRAGREGHATTLVPAQQARRWQAVLREAAWEIREVEPPGPTRKRGDDRRDERGSERRPRPEPAREERRPEPQRESASALTPERAGERGANRDRRGEREPERAAAPEARTPQRREDEARTARRDGDVRPAQRRDDAGRDRSRAADTETAPDNGDRPRRQRRPRVRDEAEVFGAEAAAPRAEARPERERPNDVRSAEPSRGREPSNDEPRRAREPRAEDAPRTSEPRAEEPRRPRETREDAPRDTRERTRREPRSSDERPAAETPAARPPRRETREEPRRPASTGTGGFGAGVVEPDPPAARRPRREPAPPPAPSSPAPSPKRAPEPPVGGGFGAGI